MNHTRDAAIRARAYQLWIECGYADGQQDANWRQAERDIAEREREQSDQPAASATATLLTMRAASTDPAHRDGTSLHPSVLDIGPNRAAA